MASGKLIKEGGIGDVIKCLTDKLDDMAKKQEECCAQILKRLDKLDDILAQLKNLQGENDKLRGEVGDLRNQQNALKDQVTGLPKPLTASQTQDIAHTEAIGAVDEAQRRNKKFSIVGVNIGPTYRRRPHRRLQLQRPRRSSSRRSAAMERTPCRRRASTVLLGPPGRPVRYRSGQPLGQRAGRRFRQLQVPQLQGYQYGGGLGQAAFMLDYMFARGRVGLFGTKGFKNFAVLNSVQLGPQSFTCRPTRASSISTA